MANTVVPPGGESLTRCVIGCFFATYNELGFGLPESSYAGALALLLRDAGLDARREHAVDVMFRGVRVGTCRLDFLVEDTLVLELKVGPQLPLGSRAQLLTYLRMSRRRLGLVLFFGPAPEIERISLGQGHEP